jgi:hypothetical protein
LCGGRGGGDFLSFSFDPEVLFNLFFYWRNFAKNRNPKFNNELIVFKGFQSPEVRFLIFLNHQIPVFDFQCVAKYIEG